MLLVRQLEQVKLPGHAAVLVGEKGEGRTDARAEGAVHVRSIDRDGGDSPVLALDLLLHRDQPAHANLLLRTPPAPEEAEHERLPVGDLRQRELLAGVLGQAEVRKRVAWSEICHRASFFDIRLSSFPERRGGCDGNRAGHGLEGGLDR